MASSRNNEEYSIQNISFPEKWKYKSINSSAYGLIQQLKAIHTRVVEVKSKCEPLTIDLLVLKKMLYCNKNSLRQHKFFHFVSQISRQMQKAQMKNFMKRLLYLTSVDNDGMNIFRMYVPTRKALEFCLGECLLVSSSLLRVLGLCTKAYQYMKYNIYHAFIVDKQMVFVSLVSRIRAMTRYIIGHLESWYTSLMSVLLNHPKSKGNLINVNLVKDWRCWQQSVFPDVPALPEKIATLDSATSERRGISGDFSEPPFVLHHEDLGDVIDRELVTKTMNQMSHEMEISDDVKHCKKPAKFQDKTQKLSVHVKKLPVAIRNCKKISNKAEILELAHSCHKDIKNVLIKYEKKKLTKTDKEIIRRHFKSAINGMIKWARGQGQSKIVNLVMNLKSEVERL